MMSRWIIAVSVIAALLVNIVFVFGCGNGGTRSEETVANDVPDCCRDGLCPYHAQEQQHSHHHKKQSDSCLCDMFSGDSAAFVILSAMPALMALENSEVVALPPAGSAHGLLISRTADPLVLPSTPPPRT